MDIVRLGWLQRAKIEETGAYKGIAGGKIKNVGRAPYILEPKGIDRSLKFGRIN